MYKRQDKGQREYYLREQMNVISEELGDAEDTRAEADTYREKVKALNLDEESTEKLLKECCLLYTSSASVIVAQLLYLEGQDPEKDIYFYINSPGGSISDGMAIHDTMNYICLLYTSRCV